VEDVGAAHGLGEVDGVGAAQGLGVGGGVGVVAEGGCAGRPAASCALARLLRSASTAAR
jgi:hypothetical protein